jgi:hypothetical protein
MEATKGLLLLALLALGSSVAGARCADWQLTSLTFSSAARSRWAGNSLPEDRPDLDVSNHGATRRSLVRLAHAVPQLYQTPEYRRLQRLEAPDPVPESECWRLVRSGPQPEVRVAVTPGEVYAAKYKIPKDMLFVPKDAAEVDTLSFVYKANTT